MKKILILPTIILSLSSLFSCGNNNSEEHTHSFIEVVDSTYLKSEATCLSKAIYFKSCSICKEMSSETFEYGELGNHKLTKHKKKESTCLIEGYEAYYTCSICNKMFSDEYGKEEIEEIIKIDKEHKYDENGVCTTCGKSKLVVNKDSFGSYPQSKVEDKSIISELNNKVGELPSEENKNNWSSFSYYIKGNNDTSFTYYIDINYSNNKYRGIYFTSFRPYQTNKATKFNYQEENGYLLNTIYWFKYESIKWNEFKDSNNEIVYDSKYILDTYQFSSSIYKRTINNTDVYPNNYKESDIRSYLNNKFYNLAFSEEEKEVIKSKNIDNSGSSTDVEDNKYSCENTSDKIYLLSYKEAGNQYENEEERRKSATDYAICLGLNIDSNKLSSYWLRSPMSTSFNNVDMVNNSGTLACNVTYGLLGVAPVLSLI